MPKGKDNPRWKGGKRIARGYVSILSKDHPSANKEGYVMEHRLVMEKSLNRFLTKEEVVHHKDGDKRNNSIENLELFSSNADHRKSEHHFQIGKCKKITFDGKTLSIMEWADSIPMKHQTIRYRLKKGIPTALVLNPKKYMISTSVDKKATL